MSLINTVTTPGIDPGTVRLLAQRLNHYATRGPGWKWTCSNFAYYANIFRETLRKNQKKLYGWSASFNQSPFHYKCYHLSRFLWFIYLFINCKGKGNIRPRKGHEGQEGEQMYTSTLPSTSALGGCGWSTPRTGRFTPGINPG